MTEIAETDSPPTDSSFAEQLAAVEPMLLEHLNGEHNDSLAFLVTVLGQIPDLVTAEAIGIDGAGIDVRLGRPDSDPAVIRINFAEPATAIDQLTMRAFALLSDARAKSGDSGELTSLEQERAGIDAIPTFFTSVVRIEQRSPHLRRITFGGGDLTNFEPLSPDQFMYVLLPPAGATELAIDHTFTWEKVREMAPDTRPQGAYYTVRHWRPEVHELDVDFVLHGDEGPASAWAMRVEIGSKVALWGPRTAYEPPATTEWYLLVADETGLPGVGAIIDSLPADAVVRAFIEVADETEHQPLRESPTTDVTWIHRNGAAAGTTTNLIDAVRAMPWPGGLPYAWGGGESRAVTAVRKYLRNEFGLERDAVSMTGYWRHADSLVSEV